jgi:hypothetical protein
MYPTVVTPECFYRGSTPNLLPGFHFDELSVASLVEPPLKASGNDGLRECLLHASRFLSFTIYLLHQAVVEELRWLGLFCFRDCLRQKIENPLYPWL